MARIRTVKPEFFRHEALFEAEQESGLPLRLAFAGLWSACDREGRFKWQPRALKLDCLPYDQIDFSAILDALSRHGFVEKYAADGKEFGFVPGWHNHQVINPREAKSKIPAPPWAEDVASQANGINIPGPLREEIFERDGNVCQRCGATKNLTIDHIIQRCAGGTHAPKNLRILCQSCNSARPVSGSELKKDLARDGVVLDTG